MAAAPCRLRTPSCPAHRPSPFPSGPQAWAAPGTGLVVNERLVNCPPELAEPLQTSLFEEMEEAAGDEELAEVGRVSFRGLRAG